ncbi:hypothetical protein ATK30_4833 [Amycolatopsis echigonensis]|uniref:Uncharacterized protein n=1 Tax=Amycolatopsis echigonensis TaxID=2576905 RepID=A0A2N3WJC3_9PSEU|nr:hypothetical protein [Amycolatopsis niigatensis]PKV93970.1 hypothetical protein ATK30_4833 [Amycolatopsis niigatensis]
MTDTPGTVTGRVPQPSEWAGARKTRYVLIAFVFALLTVGGIAVAVSTFGSGPSDPRSGVIILATPLFLGVALDVLLTRLLTSARGARGVRTGQVPEVGEPGLLVPYSATLTTIHVAAAVVCFALFAVLGIAAAAVVASQGAHGNAGAAVIAIVCLVCVISLIVSGVLVLRGKLRRGVLALTPRGVYHCSWSFSTYADWDTIMYVGAADANGPIIELATTDSGERWYRRRTRLRRQPELAFNPHIGIQARLLSADPALVYQTLRFYQRNPQARTELGTEAAVQRVRTRAVVVADTAR